MFVWRLLAGTFACVLLASSVVRAQDFPIRVQEASGRTLVFDTAPRRIVSLVPVATEILFSLGEGARLVGRSRFDDYPPEAALIPDVGDAIRPSVETVLLRDPDLVILVGGFDNGASVRELVRLGIPHLVVVFNTLENLQTNIVLLGRILGREEQAGTLWEQIDRELESVRAAVEGKPRPWVYYDVGYPPAFTAGAGSYLDALLSVAGGQNVFGDLSAAAPRVSLEAILARDPDVIVYPVGTNGPPHAEAPGDRPGWEHLRAVRSGSVLEVPSELLHRLGPRVGEAAKVLALALHPEIGGAQFP